MEPKLVTFPISAFLPHVFILQRKAEAKKKGTLTRGDNGQPASQNLGFQEEKADAN